MWNRISLKKAVRAIPGSGYLVPLYRFMVGTDARYVRLWRRLPGLFQPFATTRMDRYPDLFSLAREILGDGPDIRLLSFGCATGEEVFSLRHYFPQATIRGIDINPRNIARCRLKLWRHPDRQLSFTIAGSAAAEAVESYDAVFGMAVFRHGELRSFPERCDGLLCFSQFEQVVSDLATRLKPNGLLFIRHANFRFADTDIAGQFVLLKAAPQDPGTPVYGRDNRLLPHQPDQDGAVFRRLPCGGHMPAAQA